MAFLHDGDGIGAHHMVQGDTNGLKEVDMLALLHVLDEVGEHFRVGRRQESEATFLQFLAQAEIILNNAIVNQGNIATLGAVGMGVHLVGLTMGGPTGVSDANVSTDIL